MRLPSFCTFGVSDRSVTLVVIPEMSVLFECVMSSQLVAILIERRESLLGLQCQQQVGGYNGSIDCKFH
jgi:hypothetical protein